MRRPSCFLQSIALCAQALCAQVWISPDTQVRVISPASSLSGPFFGGPRPDPGAPFAPCLEWAGPSGVQVMKGPKALQHPALSFWQGTAWALGREQVLLPRTLDWIPSSAQRPQALQVCRDGRTWTHAAWGIDPFVQVLVPLEDGTFLGLRAWFAPRPQHLRVGERGRMETLPPLEGIPASSKVRFLARSPRGLVLLTSERELLVLSNRDGHLLRRLASPFGGELQVLVRPDGRLIVAETRFQGGASPGLWGGGPASPSSLRVGGLLNWRSTHGAWGLPKHTPRATLTERWMGLDPAQGPCIPLAPPEGFPQVFKDLREGAILRLDMKADGNLRWTFDQR